MRGLFQKMQIQDCILFMEIPNFVLRVLILLVFFTDSVNVMHLILYILNAA